MRTLLLSVALTLAACATSSSTSSTSSSSTTASQSQSGLVKPGEAKVGDKTTCPVSGETFTVAADSPKVEYKGKTYYFCCADCTGDFQKDPEKFASKFQ